MEKYNLEKTYTSIISQNPDTLNSVEEMKNEFIKKNLEELLIQDSPELNYMKDIYDEEIEHENNEFRDLIYDHVTIIHTVYEKNEDAMEKTEEKKNFRISKKTDFKSLKPRRGFFNHSGNNININNDILLSLNII
jgi:hypothetical protein